MVPLGRQHGTWGAERQQDIGPDPPDELKRGILPISRIGVTDARVAVEMPRREDPRHASGVDAEHREPGSPEAPRCD